MVVAVMVYLVAEMVCGHHGCGRHGIGPMKQLICLFKIVHDKAVSSKDTKYRQLGNSHIFVPVAIESTGTWSHQAVELVQELGR